MSSHSTGTMIGRRMMAGTLAALLAVGLVFAEASIDQTKSADPAGSVEIGMISGQVSVIGWDRPEIRVRGELGSGDPQFRFEVDGDDAEIQVKPKEDRMGGGAELEIWIPAGSSLEISAVAVEVEVSKVVGATEIETVSGDVTVREAPRDLEIEGVSGEVDIQGQTPVDSIEVEVVSGDVSVDVPLAREASIEMESVSGDLTLALPSGLSATLDVETFSGSIESELGGEVQKTSRFTPARELSTVLGDGEADIDIQTFSGTVRITKR